MRRLPWTVAGVLGLGGAALAGPELEAPVAVRAAGAEIDVEVGHAAPWFGDLDGDGLPDLLVGQFGGGKLLVFRNEGTRGAPRFGDPRLFEAGGQVGTIPSG